MADLEQMKQKLIEYSKELEQRFVCGGTFDTSCIPSGEEFIEVVCGQIIGPFPDGEYPVGFVYNICLCKTPDVALHIFCDTVERYIKSIENPSRIFWRAKPYIKAFTKLHVKECMTRVPERNKLVFEEVTYYSVYTRLLIL